MGGPQKTCCPLIALADSRVERSSAWNYQCGAVVFVCAPKKGSGPSERAVCFAMHACTHKPTRHRERRASKLEEGGKLNDGKKFSCFSEVFSHPVVTKHKSGDSGKFHNTSRHNTQNDAKARTPHWTLSVGRLLTSRRQRGHEDEPPHTHTSPSRPIFPRHLDIAEGYWILNNWFQRVTSSASNSKFRSECARSGKSWTSSSSSSPISSSSSRGFKGFAV